MGRERSRRSWFWRCRTTSRSTRTSWQWSVPIGAGRLVGGHRSNHERCEPSSTSLVALSRRRGQALLWEVETIHTSGKALCEAAMQGGGGGPIFAENGTARHIFADQSGAWDDSRDHRVREADDIYGNHLHPDEELPTGRSKWKNHAPQDVDPTVMGYIGQRSDNNHEDMEEVSQEDVRDRSCITRCKGSDEGAGRTYAVGKPVGCPGNFQESSSTTTKGKGTGNGNGGVGSSTPQSSSTQSGLQEASLKAMQGTGAPSSAESVAGSTASKPESLSTEKELMGEVASLLKSLRVGEGNPNPQLSAVRLARVLNQDKAVLIDGGATHCLRNPHSRQKRSTWTMLRRWEWTWLQDQWGWDKTRVQELCTQKIQTYSR